MTFWKQQRKKGRPYHTKGRPSHTKGWPNHTKGVPNHTKGRPNHRKERPNHRKGQPNHTKRTTKRYKRTTKPYKRMIKPIYKYLKLRRGLSSGKNIFRYFLQAIKQVPDSNPAGRGWFEYSRFQLQIYIWQRTRQTSFNRYDCIRISDNI